MKFFSSTVSYTKKTVLLNILITTLSFSTITYGLVKLYNHNQLESIIKFTAKNQEVSEAMIEHSIDTVRYSAFNAFYSPPIQKIRKSDKLTNFEMIEGMRALNALSSTNSFIQSVYVYNPNLNLVFSSDVGSIKYEDFYDHEVFTIPLEKLTTRELKNSNRKSWVYTMAVKEFDESFNSLIVNIDSYNLNKSIFKADYSNEYLYTPDVNYIFSSNSNKGHRNIEEYIKYFTQEKGYYKLNNDKLLIYSIMPSTGWISIKEIDRKLIVPSNSLILTFSSLLILILFIVLNNLNISKRYHQPLQNIIEEFEIDQCDENFILALKKWIEEQKAQKITVLSQQKNSLLLDILNNEYIDYERELDSYSIDLNRDIFLTLFKKISLKHDQVNHFMNNYEISYELIEKDDYYIIFSNEPHLEFFKKISDSYDLIIVQSLPSSIDMLHQTYYNLIELHNLSILNPNRKYRNESELPDYNFNLDEVVEYETKFLQSMLKNESDLSREYFEKWFSVLSKSRYTYLIFFFNKLFIRLRILITEEIPSQPIISITEFEERLSATGNIESIKKYILEISMKYQEHIEKEKEMRVVKLIDNIKEYVKNNISDDTFSTNTVAENFNLSTTHISRVFKTYESYSLSEFINHCRMELACQYLKNTDLPIKDIAEKCGIINTSYFYTMFKKYYNCSPTEYRLRSR